MLYNNNYGDFFFVIYTIEFQKWGLPHVHILVILHKADEEKIKNNIDEYICSELLEKDTIQNYTT